MATYYANDGLSGGSIQDGQPVTTQRLVAKAYKYVITSNLTSLDQVVLAKLPKFATVLGFTVEVPVAAGGLTGAFGTTSNTIRFTANTNFGAVNTRISSFSQGDLNLATNAAVKSGSLPYQILNTTANTGITVDENFTFTPNATWTATVDGSAYIQGFIFYNVDEPWAEVNNETH